MYIAERESRQACCGNANGRRVQQKVARDFSFYKGQPIQHMIDLHTQFSVSALLTSKKPTKVIDVYHEENYGCANEDEFNCIWQMVVGKESNVILFRVNVHYHR